MIEAKHLTRRYTSYARGSTALDTLKSVFRREKVVVTAVSDLSFFVPQGQNVGLLGPNGAGKSTLIKMLTGVMEPSDGAATVLGYVPWRQRSSYVRHIGAVFGQKSQLIWDIPPQDAFVMNQAIYDIGAKEYRQRLSTMTELFDIGDVIRKPTRQLSLGERMKCEFVMAMLHGPQVVFLDEPTIGLDIIAKAKIRDFILQMNATGVTFILTTHDLEDVERLAQRVIVINHGETVFDNGMEALRNHLGQKKLVRLISQSPLPDIRVAGVRVTGQASEHEVSLELDNEVVSTQSFLAYLGTACSIADISIQEQPIEEVVKVLYKPQP